jgi:hypothetical protein
MKKNWYDSRKFRPAHGTEVLFWDDQDKEEFRILVLFNDENWSKISERYQLWRFRDDDQPFMYLEWGTKDGAVIEIN